MNHRLCPVILVFLAFLLALLFSSAASAQTAEVSCLLEFHTVDRDYERNELRVAWYAEAPSSFDVVAIQLKQEGEVVAEMKTLQDWRKYPMVDGVAVMDVSNLKPGKIEISGMLRDAADRPCKDSEKGIWHAKNNELEWQPSSVSYTIEDFRVDHDTRSVHFTLDVLEPEYDVLYDAWIEQGGNVIGSHATAVINSDPQEVTIQIIDVDLRTLEKEIEGKLFVKAWYTDNYRKEITQEKEITISATPKFGFVNKIGKVVMAVLKNQSIVNGILLVFGVLIVFGKASARSQTKVGRPRPEPPELPEPPAAEAKLSVRIRQAATPLDENAIPLSIFPCVFGRDRGLKHGEIQFKEPKAFVNILHDDQISREHFEIRCRDNQFVLVSIGQNGTIVNKQPVPKGEQTLISLSGITTIEVGKQTKIELQSI
jgi:hypothetical protein